MDELIMLKPEMSKAAPPEPVEATLTVEEGHDTLIDLGEIARMIPDKMAFKIGEVAEIAGLKTYVLRYWESEFDALNPQKSAFNQRMYSRRDVETVLLIKKLLYEEKFSIAGAKKKIRELRRELKVEKQWAEITDRVEIAADRISDLINDINTLKSLFS
jgi:DNA-binding transcriptional MerR regulator